MRRNLSVIPFIICAIITFSTAQLMIFCNSWFSPNVKNAVELSATVKTVNYSAGYQNVGIYINENLDRLQIPTDVAQTINPVSFSKLSPGTKIYYKTNKYENRTVAETIGCRIYSLRTDDEIIFSIEEYESFSKQGVKIVIKTILPINIISLILAVFFVVMFKWQYTRP